IEIAQRAKKIMARFFVALLFFLLVVPCQADNQSSVMQKVISQQSIPSPNLFLVSKGFESVVRDIDVYLTMALKGQISVSGVLPPIPPQTEDMSCEIFPWVSIRSRQANKESKCGNGVAGCGRLSGMSISRIQRKGLALTQIIIFQA
ncbi:MAG: hypothetical protein ABIJ30_01200, partial [bacterium]